MSNEFRREYLVRLPLPLAQLYGRAYNAMDGRGRHDSCFYLCESLIKLSAAPLIVGYLDEVRHQGSHVEAIDQLLLQQLPLPSLGQWTGFLRELARHFGTRPDDASHPLGHLWDQLNTKRRDLDGVLTLFQRIKNGPEGQPAGDQSCSLLQLIDSLVQYRNAVFGHGAGRVASFYEEEMGPLLFPAVNDLLAEGTFDLLGPSGSKLVYVVEVKTVGEDRVELGMRELVGLQGERMAPFLLDAEQAEGLLPDRVAVMWPGRTAPLPLDPMLVYRKSELSEDVLFLNRDRNGKQVEYLSYATGQTERDKSMAPAMARMLSDLNVVQKPPAKFVGRLPEQFGRYKVLKALGEDSMGAVYLAEDSQLDRNVAINVPFVDERKNSSVLDRFRREAKALAAIVHPNICPIHEVGEIGGLHFISMTYVEGRSLTEYIRPKKVIQITQVLVLVRKLASALHHAHTAGVLHRDLKPANVIVNRLNEPVIVDFGLARREGKSEATLAKAGQVTGTSAYMPPEQLEGDPASIGPCSDIYSLGVILYEMLTALRPFSGSDTELVAKIAREDPPPPSQHRAEIDQQLDGICLRALAKQPQDRFGSMEEFTAALTDYLKAKLKQKSTAKPEPVAVETDAQATILATDDETAVPPDAAAGSTSSIIVPIGQGYQLIDQLGAGKYGEVWVGKAPGGIEVAIKKLSFPVHHKATQVELQALELMKRLRHAFLIQVYAYWVLEEELTIIMELADGSLEERVAECFRETSQGIPRDELFRYIRETAEAIDFLHQEQVLHRDVKPANILLVKGHVKVADFGIATSGVLAANQLTAESETIGTPRYMGPELQNRQAGPRSDQYSLAVTYVELRLGSDRLGFDEQHRLDLSLLPEKEQAVLGKALAPDPSDRYESCGQFSQALDEIVESERREVLEQRHREIRDAERKRRHRRLQLVAGGFLLACLPLGWYIWENPLWQTIPLSLTAPETITLSAGTESTIAVSTVGEWGEEPLDLTIDNLPVGLEIVEWHPVDGGAEVTLRADLQNPDAEVEIVFVSVVRSDKIQRPVMLKVEEAKCQLPQGWNYEDWEAASGSTKIEVGGAIYYDRLLRRVPNSDMRVELVLIPATVRNKVGTFYCMRNKVSNRLFAEFANQNPDKIHPQSQWKLGAPAAGQQWLSAEDHPDFPVFGVSVEDAHAFAVWFGGQLPTAQQWDTAAGFYDHDADVKGPYLSSPDGALAPAAIAINRLDGPLPVGTAEQDESHFGCRDMAGNGREWTRSLDDPEQSFPVAEPEEFTLVITRGQRYSAEAPLRYSDLKNDDTSQYIAVEFKNEHPLSFRCVVECPANQD